MAIPVKTVNDFPYWSQVEHGGSISRAGCAPTALSMVLKALGADIDPEKACNDGKGHGWSASNGLIDRNLFKYMANKYNVGPVEYINDFNKCLEYAKQGYPVILDGRKQVKSNWTENCLATCYSGNGHYVVMVAVSGDKVVINDPRGVKFSGLRPKSHASSGFCYGVKIGNKKFNLDSSKFKELGTNDSEEGSGDYNSGTTGDSGSGTLELVFNDTTTVQESLPNANVSDNWVDMHKIKGITLHMYPPYHNCTADSMAKYFKSLGWNRNFHYKVDKDTKVNFTKPPVSGQTTGGNIVGSSLSDFEVTPKDPLYSGVVIGGSGGSTSEESGNASAGQPIEGNDVATKIYNYCVSQGCSTAAACGIVGNAERESSFDPTLEARDGSKSIGLFQWLQTRRTALEKAAKKAGVSYTDADFQIQYMWQEWTSSYYMNRLKKKYNMTLDQFKKLADPKQAASIFERIFEVSAETTKKREEFAQKWYDKFSKSATTTRVAAATFNISPMALARDTESGEPFGWPVPGQSYIQSYFGYRTDSLGYNYHPGIDIVNYAGYGAYCYANGTVKKVLEDTKLSGYVRIDHGNGVQTVYGSLDEIFVKEGQEVLGGQCIGTTSYTVSNPLMHLHFEMLIDGEQVDPLEYVDPAGGNKKIPGIATFASISDTGDNVTWDKIDKGKICFASADNNTHTYIDANLFNNQHPKYTLSIGSFFYDEFDLVEKTGKVNYPKTEKVLIQQCAKALYDEGFTSKQLWREFDLNRAPSPFLYLDRDKWVAFCKEVDKQVEWLNTKYGKVTATYVPNNLLTDQNSNQFIETAPDGGINGGSGGNDSNNSGSVNLNGALFIGDSWGEGIEKLAEADGVTSEAVNGKSFLYFYNPTKNVDRLKGMKKDPTLIYVYLGLNDLKTNSNNKYPDQFYDRIKKLWPNTPVYVGKLVHSGKAWSGNKYNQYSSAEKWNEACDKFNKRLDAICVKHGWNFIDVTTGLIDSKGYLDSNLCTSDGLHLKDWQKYYDNIKSAIGATAKSSGTPIDDTQTGDGIGGKNDTGDDIKAFSGYAHKYAYVKLNKGCKFYKSGNTASEVLDTFSFGKEAYIISGSSIFYHCRVAGKQGYIRAKNLHIITGSYDYGMSIDNNEGAPCTLFPNTRLYVKPDITSGAIKTFSSRVSGKILQASGQFYRVQIGKTKGWAKAYRVVCSDPIASYSFDDANTDGLYTAEDTEYGRVYTYNGPEIDPVTGEIIEEINNDYAIMPLAASGLDANVGKYCYVSSTTDSVTLYKQAKTSSDTVASLAAGDELLIKGVSNTMYQCSFGKKTGYVSSEDVIVINKGHGTANPGYINSNCWIRFDSTDYYTSSKLTTKHKDLNEQDMCVILNADKDKGIYKIKSSNDEGWIKAYAVTFDYNEFKTAIDNTNKDLISDPNTDDNNTVLTNVELSNGDFESGESDWTKQGDIDFKAVTNPEWGTEGHWPYRGKGYARIRNINDKLAGIKHDFNISQNKNSYLRILFYVKQTTQKDFNDGPINPESLKANGIYVKLLDKNNKVKHEKKISLTGITTTTWSRVGCVINNLTLKDYVLLIGNNKKFDLLIDNVTIELIDETDIDEAIGDSNTTSGITLSGVGTTAIDNGGVMIYEVGKPTNANAKQPGIETIITQKEYEEIMKYSDAANIDTYTNSFEPYDKDLPEAKIVGLTADSRLEALTETVDTFTENMIRYKVIETGPGSVDHCVKPVDELNVLYKNTVCNVDPIYPDLVIPPKYTTSTYDSLSKNSIPLTTVEDATITLENSLDKTYSYDYELLDKKTKKSKGKINIIIY